MARAGASPRGPRIVRIGVCARLQVRWTCPLPFYETEWTPARGVAPCLTCGRRVFIEALLDGKICRRRPPIAVTDAFSFAALAGAETFSAMFNQKKNPKRQAA